MNDKKEKTETHLCPFRITVARAHKRANKNLAKEKITQELYKDSFGDCFGDLCMAYKNGHCKRLEKSEDL